MKYTLLIIILFIMAPTYADESSTSAVDFSVDADTYGVIAATNWRLILELRSYSDDHLIDDVVLSSRYMIPQYEFKDVVLDDTFEVIIHIRGGGTGIAETNLMVFGFEKNKIIQYGDFITDQKNSFPGYIKELSGEVTFPQKNSLIYRYTEEITENKTVKNKVVQKYMFNPKSLKYEKSKEPEPGHLQGPVDKTPPGL